MTDTKAGARPEVLFVCIHNAGRSQMAAALLAHHARDRVVVRSAGTAPADTINPAVVAAMAELGIDLHASGGHPKKLDDAAVEASDVVITMGCGDECPFYPGKRYVDWELPDPAGQDVEAVRPIRDEIDRRVRALLEELTSASSGAEAEHPTPGVLFLCVHNAGRSQMAAGWLRHLAGDRVTVWSGGSEPASQINPAAVAAMAEVGIDITAEFPKPWTDEIVRAADIVVTMGCGDACPLYPGKRYEDWELTDPADQDTAAVRPIRDEIRRRVEILLASLVADPG